MPSDRIERATWKRKRATSGGVAEVRQCALNRSPRSASAGARRPSASRDRHPNGPRRAATRRRISGVERGPAAGGRRLTRFAGRKPGHPLDKAGSVSCAEPIRAQQLHCPEYRQTAHYPQRQRCPDETIFDSNLGPSAPPLGVSFSPTPENDTPPQLMACIEELSKPIPDQEIFDARKPRKLPQTPCRPKADQP
jgi:hypothetical protein